MWNIIAAVMRGYPSHDPYHVALDAAIRKRFPGVECQTYKCSGLGMETSTKWWKAGTDHELLSDYKAKQVRMFVEGWVAGHREAMVRLTPADWPQKRVGDMVTVTCPPGVIAGADDQATSK